MSSLLPLRSQFHRRGSTIPTAVWVLSLVSTVDGTPFGLRLRHRSGQEDVREE